MATLFSAGNCAAVLGRQYRFSTWRRSYHSARQSRFLALDDCVIASIAFCLDECQTGLAAFYPALENDIFSTKQDWPLFIRHWKMIFFLSLVGISGFNTLLYIAVHTTTAINGALIQTTMPAAIILISLIAFKEKVSRLQSLGVGLCVLGACLVVLRGRFSTFFDLSFVEGDFVMLAAVLLYALYSVFLRRKPPMHLLSFLLYTFATGALGLLPLYLWELIYRPAFALRFNVVSSILYVATFPSIVAFFCWNWGVEQIGANRAGLFVNLIPVFASLMAVAWLGESIKAFHLIGMLLIFGGMVLFNR
jgi:drug/metabolite transporter (DMT)-like permease